MKPFMAWGLLAGLLLSGCAGGTPKAAGPERVDLEGTIIAADKALLEGSVVSDAGLAVPNARISILGSDDYTNSDERGLFRFVNVTAGELELQAVHSSYQAHVHKVTAPAGARTVVNLTLLPRSALGVELPHTHDHWGGLDTYLLFDDDIDLQERPQGSVHPDEYWVLYNAIAKPNVASAEAARWPVPLAETPGGGPALVLPGTARLTFTLTWGGDTIRTEGFGFCFDSANRDPVKCLPVSATSPATWTTDVAGDMADAGHQPYSLWSLWFYVTPLNQGQGGLPDFTYGTVHAKVELQRGEVFVDPPHVDFWANGNERLVMYEKQTIPYTCCSAPPTFYPPELVPPGTSKMRIEHNWSVDGAANELAWEYRVLVRTASMSPYTAQQDWLEPAPTSGTMASHHLGYEFDVGATDSDGYYQQSSFWRFSPYQPRTAPTGYDSSGGVPIHHEMTVTAIRAD